ncbi:MAG TPA: hypothetical protein VIL81_03600 [Candidatus Limnocylindrales bacterium]
MSRFRKYTRPEYRWCIRELDIANNLRRVAAEIDILDTALDDGRDDREEVFWGGRWVTLQDTDGLITAYHMRDGDEVSLDLVFGTDPPPEWFVNRTGTWFEALDLT